MITWGSLTGGVFGGVAKALGAFAAAYSTIVHDRRRARREEETRLRERETERRANSVAEVLGTLQSMEAEVRWMPLLRGRAAGRFLSAVVLFYLDQRSTHPAVADWALQQQQEFQREMNAWRH